MRQYPARRGTPRAGRVPLVPVGKEPRAAGSPPRLPPEPVPGVAPCPATRMIVVCGQKIALGRTHAGQTRTTAVSDKMLAIELDDAETRGPPHHHHHASP
jgi:hypothetical protein